MPRSVVRSLRAFRTSLSASREENANVVVDFIRSDGFDLTRFIRAGRKVPCLLTGVKCIQFDCAYSLLPLRSGAQREPTYSFHSTSLSTSDFKRCFSPFMFPSLAGAVS